MITPAVLLTVAGAILLFGAVSNRLAISPITPPMVFVAVGMVVGAASPLMKCLCGWAVRRHGVKIRGMRCLLTASIVVGLLVAGVEPVQAQGRGKGKGRGNVGRGKTKISRPESSSTGGPRSTRGLGGGIPTGGLGSGPATAVTGRAFQSTRGGRKGRAGKVKVRGPRHSGGIFVRGTNFGLFVGLSSGFQRSTSGLGGGIPTGGLGSGISTGVTGAAFGLASFPHAGHCIAFSRKRHGHGFIGLAHYGITHVRPDVEPGYRAVYLKSQWVPTDTGKIRFIGGWLAVPDDVDSVEPVWIPASWYETDDGSHVRVLGHWDFVQKE